MNNTTIHQERERDLEFFSRNKQAFASMSLEVMEKTGKKPVLVCLRSGKEVTVLGRGLDEKDLPAQFVPENLTSDLQRMLGSLGPGECLTIVYRENHPIVSLYQIKVAALH